MVLAEFEDVNDDAYDDSDVKVINPLLASSIRCDPRTFARRGSCVANRSDPCRVKVVLDPRAPNVRLCNNWDFMTIYFVYFVDLLAEFQF